MTQEEKARAYDEALEKIKEGLQPLPDGAKISGVTRAFLEEVFPELGESEDEKIRKGLIELVKYAKENCLELLDKPFNVVSMDAMLTWLEKQGVKKKEWSEEDERAIAIIKIALEHPYDMEGKWDRKFALDWLKSLKDRVQPQPKQEWSEEDEKMFDFCCDYLDEYQIEFLERLKARVQGKED